MTTRLVDPDTFHRPSGTYLLSHSVGLPPAGVANHIDTDYLNVWQHHPADAWPRWLAAIEAFRTALSALFNQPPEWFCPQTNVSSGLTKILHSLPVRAHKPGILISEHAFPSIGYVIAQTQQSGRHTKFVPSAADHLDLTTWADHLTADVDCVIITHVHSNTGQLLPVADIIELARHRNITTIVDVAQSAGSIPIDLTTWNADFVVGSCVKWLCGGPGAGFLWANPTIVEHCEPIDVGWFSHDNPFELDIHNFCYANDATRFLGGTPSPITTVAATHSIELLVATGIDAIRAHNLDVTTRIIDAIDQLDDHHLASPRLAEQRSATIVLDAGDATATLADRLASAHIHVDRRSAGIRVSPHLYNTEDDIERFIDVVADSDTRPLTTGVNPR